MDADCLYRSEGIRCADRRYDVESNDTDGLNANMYPGHAYLLYIYYRAELHCYLGEFMPSWKARVDRILLEVGETLEERLFLGYNRNSTSLRRPPRREVG